MASVDERVVDVVLKDLNGRAGFDHWWDDIEPDIQAEIRQTLADKVYDVLEESS